MSIPTGVTSPRRPAAKPWLLVVSTLLVVLCLAGCGRGNSPATVSPSPFPSTNSSAPDPTVVPSTSQASSNSPTASPKPSGPQLAPAIPVSNLPTITVAQLPPEGRTTLALIESNGPFPYRKDGVVFSNRERRLPKHEYGWYHEYTVVTPGSSDRGARRIITGNAGERYYTSNHYGSFQEVVQGGSES